MCLRLKLLIDMDSVMADLQEKCFDRYNKDHTDKLLVKDVFDFEMKDLSVRQKKDLFSYLDQPGFFSDLPVMPGSVKVLKHLIKLHDIIVVTTPPNILNSGNSVKDKAYWLDKHFSFLRPVKKHLVFTSRKDLVLGNLIFDDAPHNLVRVGNRKTVAMDYPYNREVETDYRVYNKNWEEFLRIVLALAEELRG